MLMTLYDDPHTTADTDELDVRQIPKSQRHPMIFARFDALAAGESFVLVNSHDPIHLREEFARDRPGAYDWRYLEGSQADDCGGSGSSVSPSRPGPTCCEADASVDVCRRNTLCALSTEWSRAMGLEAPIVNAPMGGVAGGALAAGNNMSCVRRDGLNGT